MGRLLVGELPAEELQLVGVLVAVGLPGALAATDAVHASPRVFLAERLVQIVAVRAGLVREECVSARGEPQAPPQRCGFSPIALVGRPL